MPVPAALFVPAAVCLPAAMFVPVPAAVFVFPLRLVDAAVLIHMIFSCLPALIGV